jgi:hypothetical protein
MEVDATPPPSRLAGPEDFVADEALPRILELIEESSHREAKKAAKWKREAEPLFDAVSSALTVIYSGRRSRCWS